MVKQRLRLMVDADVFFAYAAGCLSERRWEGAKDSFLDTEDDAARLLVMLGAIDEFELMSLGSEMVRFCELLAAKGVELERSERLVGKMCHIVQIVPEEASHFERAFRGNAEDGTLALRLLLACAKSAGAHAVVTPRAEVIVGEGEATIAARNGVMTCRAFFDYLKDRYGIDYAEVVL